jgi:hypothetical protein
MKYARWAEGVGDPNELLKIVGTFEDGTVSVDILSGIWRHWPVSVPLSALVEVRLDELPVWLQMEQAERGY